jgi:hypothetical protein
MREKFEELTEKYPNHSSFIVYVKAIKGTNFPKTQITSWFNKLVDKSDYDVSEKRSILSWLNKISVK